MANSDSQAGSRSARLVCDCRAELGEGPIWDDRAGRLLWVDILRGVIHRFDPVTAADDSFVVPQPVSSVLLRECGGLLLTVRDGFATFSLETGEFDLFAPVEADDPTTRMNDAACDSRGRCFAGTMAFDGTLRRGSLYRLDPDGSVARVLDGLTVSNGIGWSEDDHAMYFVDTGRQAIEAFDYDVESGQVSNRRCLCEIPPEWGSPDGLVMDEQDGLWVGFWGGSAIRRFDTQGEMTHMVSVPVRLVTKGAFGGSYLDQLFITTAREDGEPADSVSGGLFAAVTGMRGRRATRFAG